MILSSVPFSAIYLKDLRAGQSRASINTDARNVKFRESIEPHVSGFDPQMFVYRFGRNDTSFIGSDSIAVEPDVATHR